MNKRIICLAMTVALMLGLFLLNAPTAHAAEEEPVRFTLSKEAIEVLKEDEGFDEKPYWDYHHYTIGYGTICPDDQVDYYTKNPVSKEVAEQWLIEHAAKFEKAVYKFADRYGMTLTQYQLDALVLFSYNVGQAWTTNYDGIFHTTIANGGSDNDIINAFVLWSKTDGKYTKGKLRRRRCDANLYLNGVYSNTAADNFCHVLYDLNGGKSDDYLVQGYDSNITVPIRPVATREGYIFDGWYTGLEDGEKVTILDYDTKGATLYARWIPDDGSQEPAKPTGVKVTVTAEGAQHYAGPGAAYEAVEGMAPEGHKLLIEETSVIGDKTWGRYGENWIDLSYTDYEAVMEEIRNRVLFTCKIDVSTSLNIRSGPGTQYDPVGSYKKNVLVEVHEVKTVGGTQWGRTNKGWISLDYVKDIVQVWVEPEEPEEDTTVTPPTDSTNPSEPPVTEPPVTEPSVTEPPVTEPPVTEPPVTEPPVTEPPVTEPPVTEPAANTYKVTASSLNIRKSASTSASKVGSYKNGVVITVLDTKEVGSTTWAKTDKGWVSMEYLEAVTVVTPPAEPPVTEPPVTEPPVTEPPVTEPPATEPVANTYKVTASSLNIRKSASTSASKVGSYKKGTVITVLETKKVGSTTWAKTDKGWVSMEYLEKTTTGGAVTTPTPDTQAPTGKTYTVTASSLNIRKSASTSAKKVGTYKKNAKITVLETKKVGSTTWGRTDKGWISMKYVK